MTADQPRPIPVTAASSQAGLASFVRIGWVPPDFSGRIRRIDGDSPLPQQVTLDDLEAEHRNGWSAFHPEDFCHRCGNRNLCWWTPAETWNRVMRGGDPAGWGPWHEIICIPCFIELAEKAADRGRAWHLDRDENGSIRLRELGDTDLGDTEPQPVETRVEWGVKACGDGHVAGADEDLARSIVASCTSKRTHCALVSRTVTVGPWTEVAE